MKLIATKNQCCTGSSNQLIKQMCGLIRVSLKLFNVTEKKDETKLAKYYIDDMFHGSIYIYIYTYICMVLLVNTEWTIALHTTFLVNIFVTLSGHK